ncbi:MAG TPA: hypothetical protein VH479_26320 [Acidimicrobiales bacterium]
MGTAIVLFLVFVIAVLVVSVHASQQYERRRRAEVGGFAAARGWAFRAIDQGWTHIARRAPFGLGHSPAARYVMVGPYAGLGAVVFEYQWATGTGDGRRMHGTGVYALVLPAPLPWVHVRGESVRADDLRFAHDLLNPRTMEELVGAAGLTVQVSDRYLVATTGKALDLAWVDRTLQLLGRIVTRLPDYVWTDRGAAPPPVWGYPA